MAKCASPKPMVAKPMPVKPPRSTQYGRHPGTISHQETSTMRHVGGSSRENKGGY